MTVREPASSLTGVLVRHARVARVAFAQAVARDLQFRAQTWTTVLVGLVEVVLGLVPALLVFQATPRVGGWDVGLVLAVGGTFQVLMALLAAFVQPNQVRMTDYVRRGDLDAVLLRPVSTQWYAGFRWVQPAELWSGLAGAAVLVLGLARSQVAPSAGGVLLALAAFALGGGLVTLVWMNLGYLAFWFESAASVPDLVLACLDAGRYPVSFFPSAVRVGLLFVLPVGLASTVPVSGLAGAVSPTVLLPALGILAGMLVLTRLHWRLALRRYASASS